MISLCKGLILFSLGLLLVPSSIQKPKLGENKLALTQEAVKEIVGSLEDWNNQSKELLSKVDPEKWKVGNEADRTVLEFEKSHLKSTLAFTSGLKEDLANLKADPFSLKAVFRTLNGVEGLSSGMEAVYKGQPQITTSMSFTLRKELSKQVSRGRALGFKLHGHQMALVDWYDSVAGRPEY